jgi:YegS/Rv2252/BmrU family lipid kinase
MSPRPLLVVNPRSGGGATGRIMGELRAVVERGLGPVDVVVTERPGHAPELAERAAKDGRALVVAVGGDGTFSDVVDGVLRAGAARSTCVALVGQGTGGDFRKTLCLEHRLDRYVEAIASGRTRALDVGRARFPGRDGAATTRHFVNILSAGMGGLVDDHVSRASRAFGGTMAYFFASARALLETVPGRVRCTSWLAGAEEQRELESYMIAVCNGRYFGSGMHVAPMAKPDDGRFEVVSLSAPSKLAFAVRAPTIYKGKHLEQPGTVTFGCDRIEMDLLDERARKTFLLDVDGEPLGGLPLSIELLPRAITMRA